ERSDADVQHLMQTGGDAVVLELSGHLFFGTANRLLETVRGELGASPRPRVVILDFFRVRGLDASASHSLDKLAKACSRARVRLVLSGIGPKLKDAYLRGATDFSASRLAPTLDAALRAEEDFLLAERGRADPSDAEDGAALPLGPLGGIAASFPQVTLKQGEVLLAQGAASSEMFVLLSGAMHAEVSRPDGSTAIVARFVPGAIVGEIAFYSGVPRTATVIADDHAVLLRIDAATLRAPDGPATPAETVHEFAATSLARRLRTATLLLRDAEI
ncbi:MAG: cyclic nucleotide-binding domain-containing protein, partial [Aestuariivirga sp.]|nr:cyclic nucleotide-binding domain-containing protein [Aestuariivirga sp.]